MAVEGIETVSRAINAKIASIRNVTPAGLLAGGLIIESAAKKNVPVEYGFLKASGRSGRDRKMSTKTVFVVSIGFYKAYALFVHENTQEKLRGKPRPSGLGTYWNPGGSKYLSRAAREKQKAVFNAVRAYARKA